MARMRLFKYTAVFFLALLTAAFIKPTQANAFQIRTITVHLKFGAQCKFILKYPKIVGLEDPKLENNINVLIEKRGVKQAEKLDWFRRYTGNWRLCGDPRFRAEYIQNYLLDYSSASYVSMHFYSRFNSNGTTKLHQDFLNYSFKLGREVTIKDFFHGNFLPTLNSLIVSKLNEQVTKEHNFSGFTLNELHEVNFSATKLYLRIHFKRGDIGENIKPQMVTIPWSELTHYIRKREEETPFPL